MESVMKGLMGQCSPQNVWARTAPAMRSQLRWCGHAVHMSDERILKQPLCGQLPENSRAKEGNSSAIKTSSDYISTRVTFSVRLQNNSD